MVNMSVLSARLGLYWLLGSREADGRKEEEALLKWDLHLQRGWPAQQLSGGYSTKFHPRHLHHLNPRPSSPLPTTSINAQQTATLHHQKRRIGLNLKSLEKMKVHINVAKM